MQIDVSEQPFKLTTTVEVTNFVEHSKAIDNIEVICLGSILTLILLFEKRLKIKKSIKSYLESLKNETNTQLALNKTVLN